MPAPRRVAWEKGPRRQADADRDLRDGRARRLGAFVVGARSALPTSRNQGRRGAWRVPAVRVLRLDKRTPMLDITGLRTLSDSSHTGLARRGGNRIQQGRAVLWPTWAAHGGPPRFAVRGLSRALRRLGWRARGAPPRGARMDRRRVDELGVRPLVSRWGRAAQTTNAPPSRANPTARAGRVDHTGSHTISRPRGAADGSRDATRRAARARFARPFSPPS